jgi:monoamine oxidase
VGRRDTWTRREFLQSGALAGAGALALAACRDVGGVGGRVGRGTVVVVGAGLAGLVAARTLVAEDWEVVLYEARGRAGGRVLTARFPDGQTGELGGEFIDRDHAAIRALAADLDLELEPVPGGGGEDLVRRGGLAQGWTEYLDADGGLARRDRERFYASLGELARNVDPDDPPASPDAAALDRRSVADFLDELALSDRGRFFVERVDIIDEYTVAPDRLSLLQVVGDTAHTADLRNGDYEAFRIEGGNGQIADRLVEELGRVVKLGRPVTAITQDRDGVRVAAGDLIKTAQYVIVATPLPPLRAVRFDPALPPEMRDAVADLGYGTGTKTLLGYRPRVWSDEGFTGYAVTDLAVGTTWEASDAQPGASGVLLGYTVGPPGATLGAQSNGARAESVAGDADVLFPGSAVAWSGSEASIAWHDERFTGGTYTAYRPGQVTAFWRAMREPFERIYWAGEHTDVYTGYMEGAVRSGLRAAEAIIERG